MPKAEEELVEGIVQRYIEGLRKVGLDADADRVQAALDEIMEIVRGRKA